eukprot:scaffold26293_cov112-Isochrysis_galbana.AAC.2
MIPTPPPKALPCTRAIVAHGRSASFCSMRERRSASSSFSSADSSAAARIHFRSPPAQKLRPSPRTKTARRPATELSWSKVAVRLLIISVLKALWTSGRESVRSKNPGRPARALSVCPTPPARVARERRPQSRSNVGRTASIWPPPEPTMGTSGRTEIHLQALRGNRPPMRGGE